MEFNEDKRKVMGIGRSRLKKTVITIERKSGDQVELEETRLERDLEVYINSKLKWDYQFDQASLKATSVLGMLKRTFIHLNARFLLKLYSTYVRPHLEYCSSVAHM